MSETTTPPTDSPEPTMGLQNADQWIDGVIAYFTGPFLGHVVSFVVIMLVALVVSRIFAAAVGRGVGKANRNELFKDFVVSWTKRGVVIIGLIMALETVGVATAPIIAGLGIAGFVLGFALQGTLDNFASGMMLIVNQPFDVGDVIEVNGVVAKVEKLTTVNTTLLTFDNKVVSMPNSAVWGSTITNFSSKDTRRVDLVFGVGYDTDLNACRQLLTDHISAHPKVLAEPGLQVEVLSHDDSSIGFVCRPWCEGADYWDVYFDLQRSVKNLFDEKGIDIPFPQRVVHQAAT